MYNKNITFVYRNIVIGGIQTLLLRLAEALINNNFIVKIYYNSINTNGEEDFIKKGIKIIKYNGDYPKDIIDKKDKQTVIVFEVEIYIRLVIECHKYKNTTPLFLYSVHPYTFEFYYKSLRFSFLKKLCKQSYSNFVRDTFSLGYVFFMDEQCLNSTCKEYSIDLDNFLSKKSILRIIMPVNKMSKISNKKIKNCNILTVSRADFPFKGYIKGLINNFLELLEEGYDLYLTIITSGMQIDKIYEWCKGCKKIEIIKDVKYEELVNYYRNSDIYIGMGTTVLEAAAEGAITIPVSPYTYDCNSYGLFSDKPNWVLTEIGEGKSIIDLVKTIITLSENEKNKIQYKMINSVNNLYSTEVILNRLEEIINIETDRNEQYKSLPFQFIIILTIKKLLGKILKRWLSNER